MRRSAYPRFYRYTGHLITSIGLVVIRGRTPYTPLKRQLWRRGRETIVSPEISTGHHVSIITLYGRKKNNNEIPRSFPSGIRLARNKPLAQTVLRCVHTARPGHVSLVRFGKLKIIISGAVGRALPSPSPVESIS